MEMKVSAKMSSYQTSWLIHAELDAPLDVFVYRLKVQGGAGNTDVLLVRDAYGDGCRSIRSADDGDDTVRSFRIILTGAWVDFPRSLALHTVPDCNLRIRFREKRIPHG